MPTPKNPAASRSGRWPVATNNQQRNNPTAFGDRDCVRDLTKPTARSRFLQRAAATLLLVAVASGQGSVALAESPASVTGVTMGTTYTVRVTHMPPDVDAARLQEEVERVLVSIDRQMSTYRPDSEISRFNYNQSTAWFDVSPDTVKVVAAALQVGDLSAGAFDVTVGPLVDLWGFGAGGRSQGFPNADAIRAAQSRVGYSGIEVRVEPPAIRKHRADIHLDLSAIAKGFGVDNVAQRLEGIGIADYLVEIGGEIRARGLNGRGRSWTAAVELPDAELPDASAVVRLDDAAIATSGDYRNYFLHDGVRYSHVIDPRTGAPIMHELALVAVVGRSAMYADGLATALLVLGPEEGMKLAEEKDIAALFIVRQGQEVKERRTAAFERTEPR